MSSKNHGKENSTQEAKKSGYNFNQTEHQESGNFKKKNGGGCADNSEIPKEKIRGPKNRGSWTK